MMSEIFKIDREARAEHARLEGGCIVCGNTAQPEHQGLCEAHWKEAQKRFPNDEGVIRPAAMDDVEAWVANHPDAKKHPNYANERKDICPKCEEREVAEGDYLCKQCRWGV